MAARQDYYKVLGVDKKADLKEIKRAYKRLAMRNHPDINKEADAKEKFVAISEAYSVLSDPDKRRQYDLGANPFSSAWGRSSSSSSSYSRPGGGPVPDFDVDAWWDQFRGQREESRKDIDDSFEKIIDDLFTGVKEKASKRSSGRRTSIVDDFGDFLEVLLGDDFKSPSSSTSSSKSSSSSKAAGGFDDFSEIEDDADLLEIDIDDAEYVVEQLQQRYNRLQSEASKAEALASEWAGRVSEGPVVEKKVQKLKTNARNLRDRANKVLDMKKTQTERLSTMKAKLDRLRNPSSSASSSSSSSSSSASDKVMVGCPSCGQQLRVPAGKSGTARCPKCEHKWDLGQPSSSSSSSSSASSSSSSSSSSASSSSAEKEVVQCPSCAQKLRVPAGKRGVVNCPSCATKFEAGGGTAPQRVQGKEADTGGGRKQKTYQSPPDFSVDREASEWMRMQQMKQDLAKAKAEEELEKLKKELGM